MDKFPSVTSKRCLFVRKRQQRRVLGQFPVSALIVQVPRGFSSITSRTRLQNNFRVADHPARTLDGVDLGWPAFYHGPVMPDSQSSLEQAICHYYILEKLGGASMGVCEG